MIEDRDYMRAQSDESHWFHRLPVSLWLVILNAVFYAAQLIVPLTGSAGHLPPRLEPYLALHPDSLLRGHVWELLTFQLLHAGPLHLLINCAMLYIFGRPVENSLGRASLLKLYFGSGAFGGLVQAICGLLFPGHFGLGAVLGASAGVFGLIAAFATLHRNMPITMLLAFIIPVSMKAKYLLWVEVVLAALGMLQRGSDIAHAAHLGGMLAGVLYIRNLVQWRWHWPWQRQLRLTKRPRQLVGVHARNAPEGMEPKAGPEPELSTEDFLSKEVDPILDKMLAHGPQSLTQRERQILELASRKMKQR